MACRAAVVDNLILLGSLGNATNWQFRQLSCSCHPRDNTMVSTSPEYNFLHGSFRARQKAIFFTSGRLNRAPSGDVWPELKPVPANPDSKKFFRYENRCDLSWRYKIPFLRSYHQLQPELHHSLARCSFLPKNSDATVPESSLNNSLRHN
uniref:(northern house mosquito) hypothetical protein n=1 Tax=Culex pipiens TaxID=7175 RepID=A0A8D8FGW4_CULPI